MINKTKFVEIINRLRDYNDLQSKINNLFKDSIENIEYDFMNAGSICVGHESVVVELLKNIFEDYGETISWWIYECDYGRSFKMGDITEQDGKEIDLTTAEKLYDYLIKNMEENKKWECAQCVERLKKILNIDNTNTQ